MERLKDELKAVRQKTAHGKWFLPRARLKQVLTKERVLRHLLEFGVASELVEESLHRIIHSALKILAILIVVEQDALITDFLAHDLTDGSLPLFATTIPVANVSHKFFDRQWEYIAPIFKRRNVVLRLQEDHILPFLEDVRMDDADGGYANAFIVSLDPDHQEIELANGDKKPVILFRKELKVDDDDELNAEEFRAEDRILKMLNTLNNNCIVQLYISYVHRGVYNFLFPYANLDLEHFLRGSRPLEFERNISIIKALHGLSAALADVHNFYSGSLQVQLKGCHHDLKPQNILVSGPRFLLADFGLARLKEEDTNSKSVAKALGDFVAPECRGPLRQRQMVGRKSDIWSFGCIMIELLTYMTGGADAVRSLRFGRTTVLDGWTSRAFHQQGHLKTEIESFLSDILAGPTSSEHMLLVKLIRQMVHSDPNRRPNATTVQNSLRCIYAKQLFEMCQQQYEKLVEYSGSPYVLIELGRFKAWGFAVGIYQTRTTWEWAICQVNQLNNLALESIERTIQVLSSLSAHLSSLKDHTGGQFETQGVCVDPVSDDFGSRELQRENEILSDLLGPTLKKSSERFLLRSLLATNNTETLQNIESSAKMQKGLAGLGAMAELKLAVQMAENNRSPGKLKNTLPLEASVCELSTIGSHSIAEYSGPGEDKQTVLIEWRSFNSINHRAPEELLRRVDASVDIPNVKSKPTEIRVFECIGFREDVHRRACGVIYRIPSLRVGECSTAPGLISLFDLINSTLQSTSGRPYLGERFNIARIVSACIFYCHSSNWLHKRLNSQNVVFLVPPDSGSRHPPASPFIIGFNHSREDGDQEQSNGPPTDPILTPYLHPDYLTSGRFKKLFDYYSVGLLLLEVGLWQTISAIAADYPFHNSEGLRRELVTRHLPQLLFSMGQVYYKAVRACLTSELGTIDSSDEDVLNAFQMLVMDKLQQCVA